MKISPMALLGAVARRVAPMRSIIAAEAASKARDWPEAVRRWRAILESHGDKTDAHIHLSKAYRYQGAFDAAETIVQAGLARQPGRDLAIEYAEIAMARQNWAEALKRWQAVLALCGHQIPAAAYAMMCRAHRKAGSAEAGRLLIGKGLALYPKNVQLLVERAITDNFLDKPKSKVDLIKSNERQSGPVEIVICVHNAYDALGKCLDSIFLNTEADYLLTIVDDCSDAIVKRHLDDLAERRPSLRVLRNSENIGYTRSANLGLKAARTDWTVLLNSDTIVTRGWLEGLIKCARSDSDIKAVGPLSNAATIQSIPQDLDADGMFRINKLQRGIELADMAALVCSASRRDFPRVPLLNGFCMLLHRPSVRSVGYFDEVSFPRGYGEETDLCFRLTEAGHKLAIADHVYVYHSKTASFTEKERKALLKEADKNLSRMWTGYSYRYAAKAVADLPVMIELRQRLKEELSQRLLSDMSKLSS